MKCRLCSPSPTVILGFKRDVQTKCTFLNRQVPCHVCCVLFFLLWCKRLKVTISYLIISTFIILIMLGFLAKGRWVGICWCKETNSWININKEISCGRGPQSVREGSYFARVKSLEIWFPALLFSIRTSNICICVQRRRDRINEKMRALQELIPRCNKVVVHICILISLTSI